MTGKTSYSERITDTEEDTASGSRNTRISIGRRNEKEQN